MSAGNVGARARRTRRVQLRVGVAERAEPKSHQVRGTHPVGVAFHGRVEEV